MPTISYSIGGEAHDISGKSGKEVVKMVVDNFINLSDITPPPMVEKKEEEDPYLCEDCGKDFKWKSGTSSAGASVNDYHCGSCGVEEEEGYVKPRHHLEAPYEKLFEENKKLKEQVRDLLEENEKLKEEYEEVCDACEGKCRADETEECEDCEIKLRIGCANNPSNHSIFDGCCDDCREEEECEVCDTKTKTTIKTYGCMDMSVCKNCEGDEKNQKSCEYCGGYNSEFEDNCDSCGRPFE